MEKTPFINGLLGVNGIIVVAGAGNNTRDNEVTPFYPATYDSPNMIAVAASTPSDYLADFSNWGLTHVHLAAPGEVTTNIVLAAGPGSQDYAFFWGGTSAATPHVAGAAALLASAYPNASAAEIKSAILATADFNPAFQGMIVTGGRLNIARALLFLRTNQPPVLVSLPQSRSAFPGSTVTLTAGAAGTPPLAYRWFQGSNILAGATNVFLTYTNLLTDQLGLTVQISNTFGAVTSSPVQLTVNSKPSPIIGWGASAWGECDTPQNLTNFVSICGGRVHSLALLKDGTVRAWGGNQGGALNMPINLNNVREISAGAFFSMALLSNGTVKVWGRDSEGEVAGTTASTDIASISAGQFHCLAVHSNGTVVAWGWNANGQCNVPSGLSGVAAVKAGYDHSLALLSDGTVVAWGNNAYGQCNVPSGLGDVTALVAGSYASLALRRDGTVVAWGNNTSGQLDVPSGLTNVVAVSGYNHFLCLKSDGTVVAWGAGMTNQFTGGDWGQAIVPAGLSNVVAVASNGRHSLAVLASPAPPTISITMQSGNALLSWPASAANWQLLSATNLVPPVDWQPWSGSLTTNQGTIFTPVTPTGQSRFFRLRSP